TLAGPIRRRPGVGTRHGTSQIEARRGPPASAGGAAERAGELAGRLERQAADLLVAEGQAVTAGQDPADLHLGALVRRADVPGERRGTQPFGRGLQRRLVRLARDARLDDGDHLVLVWEVAGQAEDELVGAPRRGVLV